MGCSKSCTSVAYLTPQGGELLSMVIWSDCTDFLIYCQVLSAQGSEEPLHDDLSPLVCPAIGALAPGEPDLTDGRRPHHHGALRRQPLVLRQTTHRVDPMMEQALGGMPPLQINLDGTSVSLHGPLDHVSPPHNKQIPNRRPLKIRAII